MPLSVLPIGLDVAPVISTAGERNPYPLPDAQQSYRRPDHLQPSTPLSSVRKVVIGGPKRQCHDGRLRIDAGRTRQHAAIRHDDIVEAS
jgi:hypothetical protein